MIAIGSFLLSRFHRADSFSKEAWATRAWYFAQRTQQAIAANLAIPGKEKADAANLAEMQNSNACLTLSMLVSNDSIKTKNNHFRLKPLQQMLRM